MKFIKQAETFFDKAEDRVRHKLTHYPKFYALISGLLTILVWFSIWGFASNALRLQNTIEGVEAWIGISVLILIGIGGLMLTGGFVNLFGDKESIEKTIEEEAELMKKEENIIEKEEMEVKEID